MSFAEAGAQLDTILAWLLWAWGVSPLYIKIIIVVLVVILLYEFKQVIWFIGGA